MITEERLAALEAQMAALVEPPTEYYTSRYSGEEIDKGIDGALQLGGASTPQGAIAALGAGVRKNLLINPFFKVNQRGNITYTSNGYCVDNWEITYKDTGNYGVTVHDDYIMLSAGQERETRVDQFIEDADAVFGKTVTGSALLEDGTLRTGSAVFQKSSGGYTTETIYTDTTFSFLLQSGPSMNALVRLVVKEGKSVGVRAVKLEFGNTQTLAYQDDSGAWQLLEQPDPLELLKCQRYFYYANNILCPGQIKNGNIYLAMYLPTKMRVIPSMTVKSYGTIINNGVSNVPTTFYNLLLSGNILNFRTKAPANTANHTPCVLTDLNAEISAEL
jgi:hypothetical protein